MPQPNLHHFQGPWFSLRLLRRQQLLKIWNAKVAGDSTVTQERMLHIPVESVTSLKTAPRPASPLSASLHSSTLIPIGISFSVCSKLSSLSYSVQTWTSSCTPHSNAAVRIISLPLSLNLPPHPITLIPYFIWRKSNQCESEGDQTFPLDPQKLEHVHLT